MCLPDGRTKISAQNPYTQDFAWNFCTQLGRELVLDDLLSFDTNEKTIGSYTMQIAKNNGLEEVEYIISAFRQAIK